MLNKGQLVKLENVKEEEQRTDALQDDLDDLNRARVLVLERHGDEGFEEGEVAPRFELDIM